MVMVYFVYLGRLPGSDVLPHSAAIQFFANQQIEELGNGAILGGSLVQQVKRHALGKLGADDFCTFVVSHHRAL